MDRTGDPIVLATASPRRHKILREAGVPFEAAVPTVDEDMIAHDPRGTALVNAQHKAAWARQRFPGRVAVVADTVVDFGGRCLTKPLSLDEARHMLHTLSGREHTVFTGIGVVARDGATHTRVVATTVRFKRLSDADIDEYFGRVDPLDKAGAYDIDQHGDLFIDSITGSFTNVMGLPLEETLEMVAACN
jgi:septum formation protein